MDHVDLLLNISELNDILNETNSLQEFLSRCVAIVARHFSADVCSVYLYEPIQKRLTLASTIGLNLLNGADVSLKLGEGLTGLALLELRPIMTAESSRHPNYRYFPSLHEEKYDAYLGMPILRGWERIGVLVVQRKNVYPFNDADQKSLRGVANQIAAMIDYARLLLSSGKTLESPVEKRPAVPAFFKGQSASSGWAYGPLYIDIRLKNLSTIPGELLSKQCTLADFDRALVKTIADLSAHQKQIETQMADVASLIFTSHILILNDEQFTGKIRGLIDDGILPVRAIVTVSKQYIEFFTKQENPYFRQKADDIRDLALRLIDNLALPETRGDAARNRIVIASDLVPSDIIMLSVDNAAGIILISGGVTSHVSILARSLKLPLIYADMPDLLALPHETSALIDAETGNIFINPGPSVLAPYEQRKKVKTPALSGSEKPLSFETADRMEITVLANINLLSDTIDARSVNARGIGLYRSEFPFLIRNAFPVEEEQYVVYRKLMDNMKGLPVTIRTLDIGGDKALSYYSGYVENNPFLGMRSMRFCLENRDVFKTQIRAILRAGHGADLKIMFPMISSVDELLEAKAVVEECKQELAGEKVLFHPDPPLGIMIELPSAIEIIDELAELSDFFSIGTNDLVQYMLAVDRTNRKVAKHYCSHAPSVLRAIKKAADAASRAGIGISVCGDMAHDSRYLEFLIGAGIRTISIDPVYFPAVCASLNRIDCAEAVERACRMLNCGSIREVEAVLGNG